MATDVSLGGRGEKFGLPMLASATSSRVQSTASIVNSQHADVATTWWVVANEVGVADDLSWGDCTRQCFGLWLDTSHDGLFMKHHRSDVFKINDHTRIVEAQAASQAIAASKIFVGHANDGIWSKL